MTDLDLDRLEAAYEATWHYQGVASKEITKAYPTLAAKIRELEDENAELREETAQLLGYDNYQEQRTSEDVAYGSAVHTKGDV